MSSATAVTSSATVTVTSSAAAASATAASARTAGPFFGMLWPGVCGTFLRWRDDRQRAEQQADEYLGPQQS